jgi:plastocyanin
MSSLTRWIAALAVASMCWTNATSALAGDASGVRGTVKAPKTSTNGPTSDKDVVLYLVPKKAVALTPPSEPVVVLQKQLNFQPHVLALQKGTTVRFQNDDPVTHNVLAKDGVKIDKDMEAKATAEVTYSEAGVTQLGCRLHPDMGMYVVVLETPYYTTAEIKKKEVNGEKTYVAEYDLAKVPPGEYTLKVWHKKLTFEPKDVVLEAGKPLELELELAK